MATGYKPTTERLRVRCSYYVCTGETQTAMLCSFFLLITLSHWFCSCHSCLETRAIDLKSCPFAVKHFLSEIWPNVKNRPTSVLVLQLPTALRISTGNGNTSPTQSFYRAAWNADAV